MSHEILIFFSCWKSVSGRLCTYLGKNVKPSQSLFSWKFPYYDILFDMRGCQNYLNVFLYNASHVFSVFHTERGKLRRKVLPVGQYSAEIFLFQI